MEEYSWFTTKEKTEYGYYVGNVLYGAGGIAPFWKCYKHYKPPMKGRHTHNHVYNKCHKHVFRSKQARKKISRETKKELIRGFYLSLRINHNFGEFLHKIFHKNNNSTAQRAKEKKDDKIRKKETRNNRMYEVQRLQFR